MLLGDGTYTGTLSINIANVTIQNDAGAHPVIDGGLALLSDNITVQGLEILNSSWTSRASSTGIPFGIEIVSPAKNCKVINCIVHDTNTAIVGAEGLEATGNLIYNIGTDGWEHGIYINNDTNPALIRDNILMPAYGYGLHAYSDVGGKANNITFDHNVMVACPNIQHAQGVVSHSVTITDNEGFKSSLIVGQASQDNLDATVTDNHLVYSQNGTVLDVRRWATPAVTGNTIIGNADDKLINFVPATDAPMTWDTNTYVRLNPTATKFVNDDGTERDFAGWKTAHAARHADANSTEGTTLPTVNRVVMHQNPVDAERAWICVYNWENAGSVSLNLSSLGLVNGTSYILRQAQDPKGDTQPFTYDGSAVSVTMGGHTVATPTGAAGPIVATTFPAFGCWLLEKN